VKRQKRAIGEQQLGRLLVELREVVAGAPVAIANHETRVEAADVADTVERAFRTRFGCTTVRAQIVLAEMRKRGGAS
jgi:hypothetical protein